MSAKPEFASSSVSPMVMNDRLIKAKSDCSISSAGTTATEASAQPATSKLKSRSLEPLSSLAMWSEDVLQIELVKGERGLGFSILDYQDPMNKEETVIVIRSLVPGGVAQQDGQLVPGDRLMYVNDVNLAHASLDDAVQALKGAPRGIVRIGVAKPLPVKEGAGENDEVESRTRSSMSDNTEVRYESDVYIWIARIQLQPCRHRRSDPSELNTPEHGGGSTTLETLPELPPDDAVPPPLPTSPPPAEDDKKR